MGSSDVVVFLLNFVIENELILVSKTSVDRRYDRVNFIPGDSTFELPR